MAYTDLEITQQDVDNYVNSLDMDNVNNVRVLSYIQQLSNDLFTGILYYLIKQKIQISSLYELPINNITISQLIDSLSSEDPSTDLDYRYHYRRVLEKIPAYQNLLDNYKIESVSLIQNLRISSLDFGIKLRVDPLGIQPDTYPSATTIFKKYDAILDMESEENEDLKFLHDKLVGTTPEELVPLDRLQFNNVEILPDDDSYTSYTINEKNIVKKSIIVYLNGMAQPKKLYTFDGEKVKFVIPLNDTFVVTVDFISMREQPDSTIRQDFNDIIFSEVLGKDEKDSQVFYFSQQSIIPESLRLYYNGVRGILPEFFSVDLEKGKITIDRDVINILSTDSVSATYFYNNLDITEDSVRTFFNKNQVYRFLSKASSVHSYNLHKSDIEYNFDVFVNGQAISADMYEINKEELTLTLNAYDDTEDFSVVIQYFETIQITDFSEVGLGILAEYMERNRHNYDFIYGFGNQPSIPPFDGFQSYSGYCMRKLYNFIRFVNLKENIDWLIGEMAKDYKSDDHKNGIYTLNRIINSTKWVDITKVDTQEEFIKELARTYFVRVVMPEIYGGTYFSGAYFKNEYNTFLYLVSFMQLSNEYLFTILSKLRNGFKYD